ncbi:MAG TPA: sugar ABC transporter ATP-binding protein [Candidatus Choladousia intestinigallinarum]|nr:sugar ABC transporter ATP-binding protein [Candidatus Choladousia intestinigallinarum]
MTEQMLLQIKGISKSFPGARVLKDVNLEIGKGEIWGLIGENGAGKSTLIKILSGAIQADSGTFVFDGREKKAWGTLEAHEAGIVTVYQELSLVPELSAAENIHLGVWPKKKISFAVDYNRMEIRAREIFKKLDIELDPRIPVKRLGIALRQMVEIARALLAEPKLVILDEPTSSLSQDDAKRLHQMIYRLKEEGTSIIYVSHRLEDVIEVCEKVAVLKDGAVSGVLEKKEFSKANMVKLMIGRTVRSYGVGGHAAEEAVLKLVDVCVGEKIKKISLELHKGEILGIAGLMGSGRSTLAKAVFGAVPWKEGELYVKGQRKSFRSTQDAIECGIGFLPEDRRNEGIFMGLPILQNITMASFPHISKYQILQKNEAPYGQEYFDKVGVKASSVKQPVATLSGGNQQKVILARWLAAQCGILIFDEPTRGIDVASKEEIYSLINTFVQNGGAVLLISSEMPELIALSDRILVMAEGSLRGEFLRSGVSEEKLMEKMVEFHTVFGAEKEI